MDNILFPKKGDPDTNTACKLECSRRLPLCVLCVKPMLMHAYILGYQVTC